jgi:Ca2+:H+ antiporter
MGMCFFFGGLGRIEQFFNQTVATTAASLLALAIASVIIPTAFDKFTNSTDVPIARLSRGTAVVLLLVYGCYLYFQLKTHSAMYAEKGKKVPIRHAMPEGGIVKGLALAGAIAATQGRSRPVNNDGVDELIQRDAYEKQTAADEDGPDEPQLQIWVAVFTLAASTTVVGLCKEFMVDNIRTITSGNNSISVEFVGLILLPIVGNAVEHATPNCCAISKGR